MPRRAGSTSGCCVKHVERSGAGPRRSASAGSTRPWRHGRGSCRRRSGPRGSSPSARRSSAGRAPARHSRGGPVAARSPRWACPYGPTRRPASCPARDRDRPTRPAPVVGRRRLGDEQVGGDRHGVLAVEDDLVPPVAVAGLRLQGLEVQRDGRQLGPEQLAEAGAAALQPGRNGRGVRLGERVLVRGGGQTGHPLVPGGVVPGRRGQDEAPGVFAHGRPFLCSCGTAGPM